MTVYESIPAKIFWTAVKMADQLTKKIKSKALSGGVKSDPKVINFEPR